MSYINRYVDRLTDEWRQHGKIIIGVDFDDTISDWKMKDYKTYSAVIELLKLAKQTGAYIVIFSACAPDRHDYIRQYCKDNGLDIDAINENPINLPYGQHGKIYANIFLDDRAGLFEAVATLEESMYKIRSERSTQNLQDVA